ncbi:MAG: tyrosine-type recombinase/integrase [Actinophytocola sp.]|nr:tyrosine-type recombinase/integrase [Actinophytocola sp.]
MTTDVHNAAAAVAAPRPPGEVAVAGELLAQARAELPALRGLDDRAQLLAAAWLVSLRSARTRRGYAGDWLVWHGWLAERGIDVLAATRLHVDLWVRGQLDAGAAHSSVCRRLSALGSFYRYCATRDLIEAVPTVGVHRPAVDPYATTTVGLSRDEARALLAAADADTGPARLRTAAMIRTLLFSEPRVDELLGADVTDLGHDQGHRVLAIQRKGGTTKRIPLAPASFSALETYLLARAARAGLADWRPLDEPLLATATGGRLRQAHLWELVHRLARAAGLEAWDRLSPHSLRHTAITLALDAGASLRDVQDYAGHRDPRSTRRYDHSRQSQTYTLATYLT